MSWNNSRLVNKGPWRVIMMRPVLIERTVTYNIQQYIHHSDVCNCRRLQFITFVRHINKKVTASYEKVTCLEYCAVSVTMSAKRMCVYVLDVRHPSKCWPTPMWKTDIIIEIVSRWIIDESWHHKKVEVNVKANITVECGIFDNTDEVQRCHKLELTNIPQVCS